MIQKSSEQAHVDTALESGTWLTPLGEYEGAGAASEVVKDFVDRAAEGRQIEGVRSRFSRSWFDEEVKTSVKAHRAAHAKFLKSDSKVD